jgi:hypothetical protein
VSWTAIVVLAAGAYTFKVLGLVGLGPRARGPLLGAAALLPAALLPALIVVQTFADERSLTVDARAAGLAVALVAVWRRAPFAVVVVLAAAVTATVRAVGG